MTSPVTSASRSAPIALLWWGASFTIATALAIVVLDAPAARWIAQWEPSQRWPQLLWVLELIGGLTISRWTYAIGLTAIALLVLAVPRWRASAPKWWFFALVHVLAKVSTVEIKEATGRLRPSQWLEHGGPTFFVEGGISFPSGHVVYFLSLTLPLVVVAPRWAKPLLALPILAAMCRVAVNAHFLSDALGSVAWVCFVTFAVASAMHWWQIQLRSSRLIAAVPIN
jgi:PAP2 superfamily